MQKFYKFLLVYCSSFTGLTKSIWCDLFVNFLATFFSSFFYYLSYYFVHELNFSVKSASFFISFYGLGSMLGGLFGGKLSDKYSPASIAAISLFFQGLFFLIFSEIRQTTYIVISIFIFGVFTYTFLTSNYISILKKCNNGNASKLKAISLLAVISNAGLGASALAISSFKAINFNIIFAVSGLVLTIMSLILIKSNISIDSNNKLSTNKQPSITKNNISNQLKSSHTKVINYMVLISVLFIGIIISQMSTTYSLYIKSNFPEYGLGGFGIIFLINTLLIVTTQAQITSYLSDKNKFLYTGMGAFFIALGMFVLAYANNFYSIILACIFYTLGEIAFFSLSQLLCYENAPVDQKGTWTGYYRMMLGASRVIGPALGGAIYQHISGAGLWLFCFGIGAICFFMYFTYSILGSSEIISFHN